LTNVIEATDYCKLNKITSALTKWGQFEVFCSLNYVKSKHASSTFGFYRFVIRHIDIIINVTELLEKKLHINVTIHDILSTIIFNSWGF